MKSTVYKSVLILALLSIVFVSCQKEEELISYDINKTKFLEPFKDDTLQDSEALINDHHIHFISHYYDGTKTSFIYEVKSGSSPSISHWNLQIPGECVSGLTILSSSDPATSYGYDGSTQTYGLKFDTGYNDGEMRTVTFSLAGEWFIGSIGVLVKAGNGYTTGTITGPVCTNQESKKNIISGTLFFDINQNGILDNNEPGLEGINVTLNNGTETASLSTDNNGFYSFTVENGNYTITSPSLSGLVFTTPSSISVIIDNQNSENNNFGYFLDFSWIGGATANGYTIGFWKNNIDKAIIGKTTGVQISKATLLNYISFISVYYIEPLNINTLNEASSILSSNSSNPVSLLEKQLLASEFNYMNGAYINGNMLLTNMFLRYGEYIVKYNSMFTGAQILDAKNWYDAYNNSHGGTIVYQP